MCKLAAKKVQVFCSRLTWDYVEPYLNNKFSRSAILIPVFGYLILFNDYVVGNVNFKNLTSPLETKLLLSDSARLKFVYFGLVIVAINTFMHRILRPRILSQGRNLPEYMDHALTYFTIGQFVTLYQNQGNSPELAPFSKQWAAFLNDARWTIGGPKENLSTRESKRIQTVSFSAAKKTHEDLLRTILTQTYNLETSIKRKSLIAFLVFATTGYLLLLIPSFDLFMRVVLATFSGN